jgi:hypothetical protein
MYFRLLRSRKGSPYARSKPLTRFARSLSRAIPEELCDNSESALKVAARGAHQEIKHVSACSTPEALENLFFKMDVERRVTFRMKWANA